MPPGPHLTFCFDCIRHFPGTLPNLHLDEFSAREIEYGVILKDFHDFEQFPSILDSPEGQIGTSPNPDWDKSGFLLIRIGRIPISPSPDWEKSGSLPIRIGRNQDL